MQEEVPVGVGAMAAILALDADAVYAICKDASAKGIVEPANFNCPGQITVAGEKDAVAYACELAKERGQSLAQMALAWVLRRDEVASVLIGASRVSQLEDNVAALDKLEFSTEELARIDAILGKDPGHMIR